MLKQEEKQNIPTGFKTTELNPKRISIHHTQFGAPAYRHETKLQKMRCIIDEHHIRPTLQSGEWIRPPIRTTNKSTLSNYLLR